MKPINLGRKDPTVGSPISTVHPADGSKKREPAVEYPDMHIRGEDKDLADLSKLPKSGVMHVEYHVHSHEVRNKTDKPTGPKEHHMVLKIRKITHAEGGKNSKTGSEALDDLAAQAKKQKGGDSEYDCEDGGPEGNDDVTGNKR